MSSREDALLIVLNPRYLPECLLSIEQVRCPKAWVRGYTEEQLQRVLPDLIDRTDYAFYLVVSDDVVISGEALDGVLRLLREGHPVVTGYCNLDPHAGMVALTKSPPVDASPVESSYDWYTLEAIHGWPVEEPIPTHFAGMALTGMSRQMWRRFPWRCFAEQAAGWAADYHLALRLRDAGIPIVAPRDGFVYHTKPDWRVPDTLQRRRILVGEQTPEIVYER
jgi:hypothetical protein